MGRIAEKGPSRAEGVSALVQSQNPRVEAEGVRFPYQQDKRGAKGETRFIPS